MFNHDEQKIIAAAHVGGQVAKKYFHHKLKQHEKSSAADFYTRADIEAEKKVISYLRSEFPDYNIDTEETGLRRHGSPYTFIIDPIDGTNNFALGLPYFSIGIALLKKREPIFSVIYNPIANDLYVAKKGEGAFRNGKRIKVSKKTELAGAVIVYVSGYSNMSKMRPQLMDELYSHNAARVLDNWCPTLDYCLLASGQAECVITNDDDVRESLIGWLFIKEAGGLIYNFSGQSMHKNNYKKFISVNDPKILKKILPLISH